MRIMPSFRAKIANPIKAMDSKKNFDFGSEEMQAALKDIQERCRELSPSIVNRAAWRTIRNINKAMENTAIDERLSRLGMNVFDQISIYFHTRPFGDIVFGFEEYVNENIHTEMERLPESERMILKLRDLNSLSRGEAEKRIFADIKDEIANIFSLHYSSSRIQRFVNRYNLHG